MARAGPDKALHDRKYIVGKVIFDSRFNSVYDATCRMPPFSADTGRMFPAFREGVRALVAHATEHLTSGTIHIGVVAKVES
jgi:hypothetical protein